MNNPVSALLVVFAIIVVLVALVFVVAGLLALRHKKRREQMSDALAEFLEATKGRTKADDQRMARKLLLVITQNLTTGDLIMKEELADYIKRLGRIAK